MRAQGPYNQTTEFFFNLMDVLSLHDTTMTDCAIWQEELQGLIVRLITSTLWKYY